MKSMISTTVQQHCWTLRNQLFLVPSPTLPPSCLQHPVVRFNTSVHFNWAISVSPICDPLELGSVILCRRAQFPQPLLLLRVPLVLAIYLGKG
jgi:hypothetical protein